MGGSSGGSSTNTVQEIPAYEQEESQANQQLANSLAGTPYTPYPTGDLIAPLSDEQNAGIASTNNAAFDYVPAIQQADSVLNQGNQAAAQPYINQADQYVGAGAGEISAANNVLPWATAAVGAGEGQLANAQTSYQQAAGAYGQAGANFNAASGEFGAANSAYGTAQQLTNPNAIAGYMSPYIQASLAPQLSDLSLQNAQQQQQINTQATQAGAFGDARQGAAQGLQNYYTNQATNQVTSQAYQNAFSAANQALGQAQNTNVAAGTGYANTGQGFNTSGQGFNTTGQGYDTSGQGYNTIASNFNNAANMVNQTAGQYGTLAGQFNTGAGALNQIGTNALNQQNTLLNQANAYTALGSANQQMGLTGANAELSAGQLMQTQNQNVANANYQQYLNQTNYPFQMLNVREGAISNSPYNINTATTLPAPNAVAQGVGVATALSGLAGQAAKTS